jgi:hypothetical protein
MKKLLLLLFSLTLSFNSYGEWVYIDKNQDTNAKFYIESDSITEQDGYVYWTDLVDYAIPKQDVMFSSIMTRGGNCKKNEIMNFDFQWFKEPMAKGEAGGRFKPDQEWVKIKLKTNEEKIFNYVCDYINNEEPSSKEVEEDKTTDGIYKCQTTSHVVAFQEREGQEQNSFVSENLEFYFQKQNNTIFIDHGTTPFYKVKMDITESGKAEYNNMDFFEAQFGANKLVYFYPNNRLEVPNKGLFLYSSVPRNLWEGVASIIATCSLGKF